jgi:hypothetical protein
MHSASTIRLMLPYLWDPYLVLHAMLLPGCCCCCTQILLQVQQMSSLPQSQQYKGLWDALRQIPSREGGFAVSRGTGGSSSSMQQHATAATRSSMQQQQQQVAASSITAADAAAAAAYELVVSREHHGLWVCWGRIFSRPKEGMALRDSVQVVLADVSSAAAAADDTYAVVAQGADSGVHLTQAGLAAAAAEA